MEDTIIDYPTWDTVRGKSGTSTILGVVKTKVLSWSNCDWDILLTNVF